MEIIIYLGIFVGIIFWIRFFVEDADPKREPIQAGLKKLSDGQTETFEAIGKALKNSVDGYKYKRKFEAGEKISGDYIIPINLEEVQWEVHVKYRGGLNSFDIERLAGTGDNVDVWSGLTEGQKYSIIKQVQDYFHSMRIKAELIP